VILAHRHRRSNDYDGTIANLLVAASIEPGAVIRAAAAKSIFPGVHHLAAADLIDIEGDAITPSSYGLILADRVHPYPQPKTARTHASDHGRGPLSSLQRIEQMREQQSGRGRRRHYARKWRKKKA